MLQYNIVAKDLTFFYQLDNIIFSNANFTFTPSSPICYIQGENGTGKTTFLELLLKLQKPKKGELHTSLGSIGYVPSSFSTQFPISVKEFLKISKQYSPNTIHNLEAKKLLEKLKDEFCIPPIKDKLLNKISHGQLQKVLLFRAFSYFPNCVMLDEPFSHLDERSIQILSRFLIAYSHTNSAFLILIDHQKILQNQQDGDIIELQQQSISFHHI